MVFQDATSSESAPQLDDLGRVLLAQQSLDELLGLVVQTARRTTAGVDGVTLTLGGPGRLRTAGCSDEVVRELDEIQYRYDEGPCVDAVRLGHPVTLTIERRHRIYPRFNAAADQRFMTAVLSVPLVAGARALGSLNFYSASFATFSALQLETLRLFAEQASVLVANGLAYADAVDQSESLRQALATRETIGMAKGIIMARERCSPDEAFDRLRIRSQHTNRKLRELAEEVVREATGRTRPSATTRGATAPPSPPG